MNRFKPCYKLPLPDRKIREHRRKNLFFSPLSLKSLRVRDISGESMTWKKMRMQKSVGKSLPKARRKPHNSKCYEIRQYFQTRTIFDNLEKCSINYLTILKRVYKLSCNALDSRK